MAKRALSGPFVLASHGTHSPLGRSCVRALTQAVRLRHPDIEFVDAFVNVQDPTPDDVVRELSRGPRDRGEVTIVPVLLSAGFHVRVDLRRAADVAPGTRVVAPLGPDPRLAAVLARRLAEAGLRPDDARSVTIADAGSRGLAARRDINAMSGLLARHLRRAVAVSHASAAEPLVGDLVRENADAGRATAVATYLLAPGHFTNKIAHSGAELVTPPLIPPPAADDPAAVPPELVELVLDRAGLLTEAGRTVLSA